MKLVYLIHAHKNPRQLNQLIDQIADGNCVVYVNVDQKSSIDVTALDKRAHLIQNRTVVQWGQFSQVEATLKALEEIEAREKDYSHVLFISGQDFPVKTNAEIVAAMEPGKDYIDWQEVGGDWMQKRYNVFFYYGDSPLLKLWFRAVNKLYRKFGLRRKAPYKLKVCYGSSWWTLSRSTIQILLRYAATHKKISRFFQYAECSDEFFFHTIVCNSVPASQLVNNNMRYIKFIQGNPNPEILDASYYDAIIDSDGLFCRKIDSPKSDELVSMLSARRRNQTTYSSPTRAAIGA